MKTFIFLIALIICATSTTHAQYFVRKANRPLPKIDSFLVKYGIEENLIRSYSVNHKSDSEVSPSFTYKQTQKHATHIPLTSFTLFQNDSVQVRTCHFTAKGADRLSVQLKNLYLSKKAKLYFYSGDHSIFAGPITDIINAKGGFFPTLPINSDELTLVLIEPKTTNQQTQASRFTVEEVWSSQYKTSKFLTKPSQQLLNDSPNIACYFPQWRYESDAVAIMYLSDAQCSCTLLNNENNDRTPYVMTSRHCITEDEFDPHNVTNAEIEKLNSTYFEFLYRYSDCYGNHEEETFTVYGGTYLDSYFGTDHLFLRLNDSNLPPFLNYVGWDRSSYGFGAQFNVTGISHPAGNRQKYTYGTATNPGTDGNKYGVSWIVGNTEPGSSGSALFNDNHKFVGQLSYLITYDNYGKLSNAWSTPYGGVHSWLSPSQNLTSMNPLIPMVMYGPSQLCYGSQGTVSMPNLKPGESATWNVTGNLVIVSSTSNSVVITPNGPSASGKGTVTATISGHSTSMNLSVGVPDQSNIFVINNTTGSQGSNVISFCFNQTNNLQVYIDPTSGSGIALNAQWTFPTDYSPSTPTGTQVQTTPTNLFSNNSFSVKVQNNCGWQSYPTGYGAYLIQCGGYYSYQVYPNPAKDFLTVEFERTSEKKIFPEVYELYQQDINGTSSAKAVRTWGVNNSEENQQLKSGRKLDLDVKDLPRGTYILQIKKQTLKQDNKKVDAIRVILE